jgi:pentatricopeptide repeat protein
LTNIDNEIYYNVFTNLYAASLSCNKIEIGLGYLSKAKEYAVSKRDYKLLYNSYIRVFLKLNQFDKVDYYFNKMLENCSTETELYNSYIDYGFFLIDSDKDTRKGLQYILTTLNFFDRNKIESPSMRAFAYQCIALFYKKEKQYFESLKYYQKAMLIVADNFSDSTINANPSDIKYLFS